MIKKPFWVHQYLLQNFSSGPTMGRDGYAWIRNSERGMTEFFKQIGATNIVWHDGHYDWSCFAKVGEQWWYFSCGDCRFKNMPMLLVRRCAGPKDYSGQVNQWVDMNTNDFDGDLKRILCVE